MEVRLRRKLEQGTPQFLFRNAASGARAAPDTGILDVLDEFYAAKQCPCCHHPATHAFKDRMVCDRHEGAFLALRSPFVLVLPAHVQT